MNAYLDNNVVSAIAKDDTESESEAIDRLLEERRAGLIGLVTSELTLDEIKKYNGRERTIVERVFRLLESVPVAAWDKLLGIQCYNDQYTSINSPMIERDSLYGSLLTLGLVPLDAQHVFVASKQGCDVFLTCDGGVLHRAGEIRRLCGMRVEKPSEFMRDSQTRC